MSSQVVCAPRIVARLISALLIALSSMAFAAPQIVDAVSEHRLENKHKAEIYKRFTRWERVLKKTKINLVEKKVVLVNDFFNNKTVVDYAEDIYIWHVKDYWATPIEFMDKGYGDCEDYSIAKYFTLLSIGVPDEELRVTYVKLKSRGYGGNRDLAHMVLTFYPKGAEIPFVLDNVDRELKAANTRTDLKFIYSFNGKKLWVAKNRKYGVYVGDSSKIKKWTNLRQKLKIN